MPFVNKNKIAEEITSTRRLDASAGEGNARENKTTARGTNSNNVIVNRCQEKNPVLSLIKSVAWEFGATKSDYEINQTTGSLFLSLKYYKLHPDYLDTRLLSFTKAYDLKILLCLCDIQDHENILKEITKICLINNLTLIVGWSNLEIARYIQTYKSFERRPADLIKEKIDDDYISRLTNVLTTIRGINKTDVLTLATNFRSFRQMVEASPDQLFLCPGLGEKKVKRLLDAFNSDF